MTREYPMLMALGSQVPGLGQRGTTPTQVFALSLDDTDASINLATGIILLFLHHALVLFDSGAMHSFVSLKYACFSEKAP